MFGETWKQWLNSRDRACRVAKRARVDAASLKEIVNRVDRERVLELLSPVYSTSASKGEIADFTPNPPNTPDGGQPIGVPYLPDSEIIKQYSGGTVPESINKGGDANAILINNIIQRCRLGNKEMCRFPEQWSESTRYQEINRFLNTWKYTNQQVYKLLMADEVYESWAYDVNTLLEGEIIVPGKVPPETEKEFYRVTVPWAVIRRNWRRMFPREFLDTSGFASMQDYSKWDYYLARTPIISATIEKRIIGKKLTDFADDNLPSLTTTWYFTILVGAGTVLAYALIKT